jgi:threonine dehydrogenase-like Zn-dependent dehydrogenase
VSDRLINMGVTVTGAFGVNAEAYIEAIRIIESGRFPLEKMHSGKFELADTEAAIQSLADGEAVHVCVCPDLGPTRPAMSSVAAAAQEVANAG